MVVVGWFSIVCYQAERSCGEATRYATCYEVVWCDTGSKKYSRSDPVRRNAMQYLNSIDQTNSKIPVPLSILGTLLPTDV